MYRFNPDVKMLPKSKYYEIDRLACYSLLKGLQSLTALNERTKLNSFYLSASHLQLAFVAKDAERYLRVYHTAVEYIAVVTEADARQKGREFVIDIALYDTREINDVYFNVESILGAGAIKVFDEEDYLDALEV